MTNFQEINKFNSMYLTDYYEPRNNVLLLEITESSTSDQTEDVFIGDKKISDCRRLSINETGVKFTISFPSYVSFQVFDEGFLSFNDWDEYEAGEYNTFCIFKKSRYMEFIKQETIADHIFPGELTHYGLYSINHVVYVVSAAVPTIDKI